MALFRPQQDFNSQKLGEEFYYGVVVDNNDPEKLRRIKVRIEDLHGTEQEIPDSDLPWAIQFRPTFLGGDVNLSTTAIPRIGSNVIITHNRGDIHQPAYMFELSHNSNRMEKGEEDYPDSYVLRDSDDNFWHVNLVQDKLDIKFNGDEFIEITANRETTIGENNTKTVIGNELNTIQGTRTTEVTGDESKTVSSNQSNTIDGDRTENVGGNLNQTVTGNKTVTTPTLTINCSSAVNINAPITTVSGNVTVGGSVTATGDVIGAGVSLSGHTHPGDSGGTTGPPN